MKKDIFNAIDSADKDGIAIEALMQAELQFLSGDYDQQELEDALKECERPDFSEMAYKDDFGFWRVTGVEKKFDSIEHLNQHFTVL